MKNVALIQLADRHTEIIGGMVSMLLRKNVNQIIIYTPNYKSSFVPYYQKLFKNIKKKIKWVYIDNYTDNQLEKKITNECDFYIYLTGPEYEDFKLAPKKTLLIYHHTDEIYYAKWNTCNQIALSPIFDQYKIKNFLNVFKGNCSIKTSSKKMEIIIVGLTNPKNKDLARLRHLMTILSKNDNKLPNGQTVLFHIINFYKISKKFKPFEKNGLLNVYIDISAIKMMNILCNSTYAMVIAREDSSYHNNQLSGIIPLAISSGIPLICDKELAKIYGMSHICITYEFTGDYLYRALQNAASKNINTIKKHVIKFRNTKIKKNKKAIIPCLN